MLLTFPSLTFHVMRVSKTRYSVYNHLEFVFALLLVLFNLLLCLLLGLFEAPVLPLPGLAHLVTQQHQ